MKRNLFILTLVTILSGFFFFSVYNYQMISNPKSNPQKNNSLIRIIENLRAEIIEDEARLEEIKNKITLFEEASANEDTIMKNLRAELYKERRAAGLTALKGKGIKIILDDNKEGHQDNPDIHPNNYIVHYESLLAFSEELKRAGAEAVSINDQRLITSSDIRCVGNVVLVNTIRIAPPFEISAIGHPTLLEKYILNSSEYLFLTSSNFPVSYKLYNEDEDLIIPAYKNEIIFTYSESIS
jgi:uncharacterized protein YlxW (UPF0749 family)